ncbi:hypothetical protein HMPREF3033_01465 [Veillonellaceae bacterium DNF00751]|uniref:Uncharacterized protein n=1 Tax=Megasphaera lornae TaxID=1000568 RepID=D3LWB5_9FIRM|nr:hypothetical protein HMPREF0889_1258 [Megasphaera genomosp. type_1 str. 28L]EGL41906.1 hypothetical protein HMPREF1039_0100 [Megasphaera lornae]KXB90290.1 hypothetical protein HMPREF3033_01465 [Veillonellaceae bacterium DNF00751]
MSLYPTCAYLTTPDPPGRLYKKSISAAKKSIVRVTRRNAFYLIFFSW